MKVLCLKHKKDSLFLCVILIFFSCQTEINQIQSFSESLNKPIVSTTHAELLYTKNGRVSFILTSPQIDRFGGETPYLEFPKGLEVNSYELTGKKKAHLFGNYAIKHLKQSLIEAKGGVVLKNAKGESLETEYLIWDEQKEQIYTEEFVKITKASQVIMGEGFVSDIYFSNYSIKKSKGIINIEKDSPKKSSSSETHNKIKN